MQTPQPTPPAPPALPANPAGPALPPTSAPPSAPMLPGAAPPLAMPAGPFTAQDVAMLRARRSELSNQLQSADGRRERLVRELQSADDAARPGLEQRLAVLDKRIVQIETDIGENGRQLASATLASPGRATTGMAGTREPPGLAGLSSDQTTSLGALFTLVVMAPMAFAAARMMWKRGSAPARLPTASAQSDARLERLEQAVDAIAVEIERVSEGQRYVTRLLSEAHAVPALGVGQPAAEPVRIREGQAVRAQRSDG